MSAQRDEHVFAIRLADYACRAVFQDGYVVAVQSPIDLAEFSEPEPDIMVLAGNLRDHKQHPTHALLIIEIASTNLTYDRVTKASLYASHPIADYWIVNLVDETVEVLRKLMRDDSTEFGWAYADKQVLRKGDTISPLAKPDAVIETASLLPE